MVALVLLLAVWVMVWTRLLERPPRINPHLTARVLDLPQKHILCPALSPDGTWLAYPAAEERGRWDVYLARAAGGAPRRVTADSCARIGSVDLSPDGSQLVYDAWPTGGGAPQIRMAPVRGGPGRALAAGGCWPAFRPDGRRIGFLVEHAGGPGPQGCEFWTVAPDGSGRRMEFRDTLTTAPGASAFSWAPSGKYIAWVRGFPGGYQEVFLRDLARGRERQITRDQRRVAGVCWTPQNEILYATDLAGGTDLWLVGASGGAPVRLTRGPGAATCMRISADGRRVLYLEDTGSERLVLIEDLR
ncbi:MAG TPA: hypothetical protein VMS93_14165 [Candidatus Saccharimonadales bacterium]|nr:hypothetical protein [Candidatus Saccharimonadales bacterium]